MLRLSLNRKLNATDGIGFNAAEIGLHQTLRPSRNLAGVQHNLHCFVTLNDNGATPGTYANASLTASKGNHLIITCIDVSQPQKRVQVWFGVRTPFTPLVGRAGYNRKQTEAENRAHQAEDNPNW